MEFGLWIEVNSTIDEKLLLEFDISKSVIENKLFVEFWRKVICYRRYLHLKFELEFSNKVCVIVIILSYND